MLKILLIIIALIILFISYFGIYQASSENIQNKSYVKNNQDNANSQKFTTKKQTNDIAEKIQIPKEIHFSRTEKTMKNPLKTDTSKKNYIDEDEKNLGTATVVVQDMYDEESLQEQAAKDVEYYKENLSQEERDLLMKDSLEVLSQDSE